MSPGLQLILIAVACAAAGAIATWLYLYPRIRSEYSRANSEFRAERATLIERLQNKDQNVRDLKSEIDQKEAEVSELRNENAGLGARAAALQVQVEQERKLSAEKLLVLDDAKQKLADAFVALSANALKDNSEIFLNQARESLAALQKAATADLDNRQKSIGDLMVPLRDSLDKVDSKIRELESLRASAYSSLHEQVKQLSASQTQLQTETSRLVNALRSPAVRGRWGEIQLRRVVELAGMLNYCDFTEQPTIEADDGRLRPDLIVRLPNARCIVVDSKAPIGAYYESLETADEVTRASKLKDHARLVRTHLAKLGAKGYWDQLDYTPEFVVLFLPGETFFSAALEQDPSLIEFGVDQKVILATPTTLIALLKAVAYGWKQELIADHALSISKLGKEMHERLRTLAAHFADVGKKLDGAVESYNRAVGSLESRVLVSARRFKELGASSDKEIEEVEPVEKKARYFQIEETRLIPGLLDEVAPEGTLEAKEIAAGDDFNR
ncbi:MAG TPA: DNA recombination protein RmuC [Blastocatellia bacterium]|nr:DNA recombination protein RmuC [Blastocatellia bacterium]